MIQQIEKGAVVYATAKVIRRKAQPGALQYLGYLCILEAKKSRDLHLRITPTSIFRVKFEPRIRCIVLGKSYRHMGHKETEETGDGGYYSYFVRDGGSLEVWIVEPFHNGQHLRYYKPIAVLEGDLSYDIDAPIHEILNY